MSSWGPGFVQQRGHINLSHYHQVGFGSFAEEYFKLIRSVMYTQSLKEFLFVFDKMNSASTSIGLFEYTLKKNNYIRFIPYYPSSGFSIADRKDLLEPSIHKHIPDRPSFFSLFASIFNLQDKIKDSIHKLYDTKEVPMFAEKRLGVCLRDGDSFDEIKAKIQPFLNQTKQSVNLFVSAGRDQYRSFKQSCPSDWIIYSMWDTLPDTIVTGEQKMDVFYASLGMIVNLQHCDLLIGSFHDPVFRFLYCFEKKFRESSKRVVVDSSSFSYF
jgi:hypothetical protein